jgi:hypothetical protein
MEKTGRCLDEIPSELSAHDTEGQLAQGSKEKPGRTGSDDETPQHADDQQGKPGFRESTVSKTRFFVLSIG